jgi:hypothetical protein
MLAAQPYVRETGGQFSVAQNKKTDDVTRALSIFLRRWSEEQKYQGA